MRTGTWIFGIVVGVVAFQMYARRADTGDKPGSPRASRDGAGIAASMATEGPGAGGAGSGAAGTGAGADAGGAAGTGGSGSSGARTGAAAKRPSGSASESAPEVIGGPDADIPIDGAAAALAATLHGQALQVLESGDEARGALLLYRVARARTNAPEREDAARRLVALGKSASERAARSRSAGAVEEERAALSIAYLACAEASRRAPMKARLDELSADVVFSSRASGAAHSHTVKPGESLVKVAATYNFPAEGIQRVNRLKSTGLRVGERLKVPRGPVELFAVKSEFRLVVLFGGLYAREYACGTGKGGCTPEATFAIDTKIEKPTYFSRDGTFPFGHEKNILGTRWLGFKNTDEHKGFGIHGTAFPESIGKEASSGCVRLRNEDVEDLFGWVPKGTSVVIVR